MKAVHTIVRLALPILCGNLSYACLGLSDMVMAGMAGTSDLAGVAIGGSFFFPASMFIIGMMSALQPLIARHRGAQEFAQIPHTHLKALLCSGLISILIGALLIVLALYALDIDSDARMEATARGYIIAVGLAMPFTAAYAACRGYCEAMGRTRATLYFGVVALCYNIPLNYIFIFGKMGAPALGGAGCGVATLISIILSLITFMGYIRAVPMLYRTTLRFNTQPLRAGEIRSFYRLSLPLGLAASVECSCFTLIALLLSPLGPEQVSAHSIAMSATSCLYNLPLSMGIAASIAVGYNIGSGNLQMLRAVIQAGYRLAFAGTAINIALILLLRERVTPLFTDNAAASSFAAFLLLFSAANQFSENTQTMQAFILRGFKDSAAIFKGTIMAFYCAALPLGYALCYGYIPSPFTGPEGFWIGIFTGLSAAAVYYRLRVLKHYRALKAQLLSSTAA